MTYPEARDFLFQLPRFGLAGAAAYHPGLDKMKSLAAALGDPHLRYPVIHVAGTNGKGSTCSLIAAAYSAAGYKSGLHTSPHLIDFAERMRIDGKCAPHVWIANAVGRFKDLFDRTEPSFFEASVALSFLYFAESGVDIAVIETGLGGRLDATNIVQPTRTLITHVALDHTDILGDTLSLIASEKAGIVKPGVPLLTSAVQPEVIDVLKRKTDELSSPFNQVWSETEIHEQHPAGTRPSLDVATPVRRYAGLEIGLPGVHQTGNVLLALRAVETGILEVGEESIRKGFRDVVALSGLRGRCEPVHQNPLVILDVAHNADGLETALTFCRDQCDGRLYVILGIMADKNVEAMARSLKEYGSVVIPFAADSSRALSKARLRETLVRSGVPCQEATGMQEARSWFFSVAEPNDVLLVAGSHLTVEAWLKNEARLERNPGNGNHAGL